MRKSTRIKVSIPLAIILVLILYLIWALIMPLPMLKAQQNVIRVNLDTPRSVIAWPGSTQAAVGILGDTVIETNGTQTPVPTASTAKLITALMILKAKPLGLNQPGPTVTFGPSDVAIYNNYVAEAGSVVQVVAGEQMSEYQALEAMLLPSANNIADSLAIWAYGSLSSYKAAASQYITSIGLKSTTVGTDASGFAPSTVSTASDLVKLGEIVMQNPVLTQIVGQSSAAGIPVVSTVKNVNYLLSTNGIIGIKTGNSDQAGGVFVGADRIYIEGKPVTVITSLIGAANLATAMSDSLVLINSATANFKQLTLLPAGSTIGYYKVPGGNQVPIVTSSDLVMTTWQGQAVIGDATIPPISYATSTSNTVAKLVIKDMSTGIAKSVNLTLGQKASKPPIMYRLVHP